MTDAGRGFRFKATIAFTLVYILWGSTYLAIGIAVKHIPPFMMGALRFIIAGTIMLGWRLARGFAVAISGRDLFRLTTIGVLLLSTGNVVLGWAETYIATSLAALLIAITPLWFLILERFSHRGDRLSPRGLAGIALGLGGVIVLMWPGLSAGMSIGRAELIGGGLVLISSVSWAIGSVLSKRWHVRSDPYTASGWEMLMAGFVNLAVALGVGELPRTVWNRESLLAVGYLVVAGSLIGFTAYLWLLRNVSTPKVATYAYVNPLVALFLGWLVLGENIDGYIITGTAIVILSIILVTGAKLKHADTEEAPGLPDVETTGD